LNGVPFRGLIRKTAIDRIGPIRLTEFDSAFEEFVWVGKLARDGNLHYAERPVYFKRAYAASTHAKFLQKDRLWKRAVWLEFGLGMLETIWPLVREEEHVTALATVLDRLCIPKEGRFLFYDGPTIPFASDFITKAVQRFSLPAIENFAGDKTERLLPAGWQGNCWTGPSCGQCSHKPETDCINNQDLTFDSVDVASTSL